MDLLCSAGTRMQDSESRAAIATSGCDYKMEVPERVSAGGLGAAIVDSSCVYTQPA